MANVDLSKLSDEQLNAIASGDLKSLPDDVLQQLSQSTAPNGLGVAPIQTPVAAQPASASATAPASTTQFSPYGINPGGPVLGEAPESVKQFMYSAVEQIPPALVAMRTAASATPQGLAFNAAATGITAALASLASASSKGEDVTSPEVLGKAGKAGVEFGVPGPILGGRAVFGLQGGISKGIQGGILTGASILAARETEAAISGKPAKPLTRENVFDEVVFPSLISGSLMSVAQVGGRLSDLRSEALARRSFLQSLGVRNPTLGALLPSRFNDIEYAVARDSGGLTEQRRTMGREASDAIRTRFNLGNYASNETVANRINPQIQRINAADDAYQAANQAYEQANARSIAAQADMTIPAEQRAQLVRDAQEQVYRSIQDRANAILNASQAAPMEMGGQAERVSATLRDLLDLRRNRAQELYAPLRNVGAIFSIDEIEQAARRGMGNYANTEQGQALLAGIRNYRGDGVVVTPSRPNPAAVTDPTAPQTLAEVVNFDLEGVRQMREELSSIIDNQPGGVVGRMEREAGRAYNAINEAIRSRLQNTGGEQLANQWDQARQYWASSFRAMENDDRAFRMIIRGRATPQDLEGIATRLVKNADASTIRSLSDFVDSVSGYDPIQRNLALSQIGSAVTNRLIWEHTSDAGVNWSNLLGDVLRFSNARGMEAVFPVERLGLGTRTQIAQNRAVVRDFARRGLTNEAIGEAFASPLFTQAVEAGTNPPRALNRALAEAEFRQRTIEAEGLMAAGLTQQARARFAQAEDARRIAQLDQTRARQIVEELQLDPSYQVLTGQAPLTNAPEVTAGRIGDLLMRSDTPTARRWISHIERTDPAAYNEITTNTLANFLQQHLNNRGEVNLVSLRQAFSNNNTEFAKLRAIIPAQTMDRLSAMPDLVRMMDDALNSRPVSDSSLRRFAEITGITTGALRGIERGVAPSSMFGLRETIRKTGSLIADGSYHIIAHQLLNPSTSLITPYGQISDVIARMPTQQAVIMLNNTRLAGDIAKADAKAREQQRGGVKP